MRGLRILRVEVRRILLSRPTWIVIAMSCLSLLVGFGSMQGTTMTSIYLAEQVKSACQFGTVLFALLTLFELSRAPRSHTDTITDSIVSPVVLAITRIIAIAAASLTATVLSAAIYMPYAICKLGIVFSFSDYLNLFFVYILPAQLLGSLAAAAFYQVTRRIEVSALLVLAFMLAAAFGLFPKSYLWQWYQPPLPVMSDDFSNAALFRIASYSRLVWLALLGSCWVLSLLCIRRYGRGLLGSIASGIRRFWIPAISVVLLLSGILLWRNEPFFDCSPVDWMSVEQINHIPDAVFLEKTQARIEFTRTGRIKATSIHSIRNESGSELDFYFSLNAGYKVRRVTANGELIAFDDLHNDYFAYRQLRVTLPGDEFTELRIEYDGLPKEWNTMQTKFGGRMISDEYIMLLGKSLTPVLEVAADNEAPFVLDLRLPGNLTPVTSGYAPELISENNDGTATWRVQDIRADNMTLFAGDYVKMDIQGGGIPIEFYYSRKHKAQMERFGAMEQIEAAVRFCTEHYGPRAFTEDRPFRIIQGSEFLFGGFARQNISTMSEESFTVRNLADSNIGASGAEVLAHEIIHQWWGLGVMFMDPADPFWQSEGITTYTTYRLMKELRGEDYANNHYRRKWETAVAGAENNFYSRYPEYADRLPAAYRAELEMLQRSVNVYSGYALMFCKAAELMGGEEKLDEALSKLYREGGSELPPYITLNDFLSATGLTKEDLGIG